VSQVGERPDGRAPPVGHWRKKEKGGRGVGPAEEQAGPLG
jgi:hypothetical protein